MTTKALPVYKHVFESAEVDTNDLMLVQQKIERLFQGKCQRILLVSIPQIAEEDFIFENAKAARYPCFPPYGPGLLVRALEENGYAADILDLGFSIMAHAKAARAADDFQYRIWEKRLQDKVDEFRPDLIGLSCMFNMGHFPTKNTAEFLKKLYPSIPVIVGGVHPSLTSNQVLDDCAAIDFVALYEADQSFVDFLNIAGGKSGIESLSQLATKVDGKIIKVTKRALPMELKYSPNYKALPIEAYSNIGKIGAYTFLRDKASVAGTVLSTRGCRAACGFCSVRSVNGMGVRVREHEQVIEEIGRLKSMYGVSHIMWLDDDLFYNLDRAISMFEDLAARKLGITWDASNGIIAAALTPRLIRACVDSGCVGFNIGVESGNPEMLKMMKKPGTVDSFRKAAKLLEEAPQIFTKGFLVIGFPNETLRMLLDTVELAVEMAFDWYPIQILTPMPGTPIYQMMRDQGLLGDIPTTTLGKARTFSVGATGRIGQREKLEKSNAKNFKDLFAGDRSRVPAREEMEDLWFTIDYKINYEGILKLTNRDKLLKKRSMLKEICERMTNENALGMLFWGITEHKLGHIEEAGSLIRRAKEHLDSSDFWRKRFDSLQINNVMKEYLGATGAEADSTAVETGAGSRDYMLQNYQA